MVDRNQTFPPERPGSGRSFWILLAILILLLSVLFRRSFEADQVHFSNDGPLGAAKAQSDYAWKNLTGYWQDLNWLGGRGVGGFPSTGYLLFSTLGALTFSKFVAPLSLLMLGIAAWLFFRKEGFQPAVCVLGGLAAALNMNALSVSCWGIPGWTIARATCFLSLAAVATMPRGQPWARAALAGLALGMGLMDGFDVGAIYCLYVAAFVIYRSLISGDGLSPRRVGIGVLRVAVVALLAAILSAVALSTLIGTQVKGIAGLQQDAATKERRWDEATRASLAPVETLRLFIPGLFGYRVANLYYVPPDSLGGANYWGTMGATEGYPQTRHSGNGEFAGVLVCLVAAWAVAQSFRRKNGVFTDTERRLVWFWAGAAALSLLLAWGKYSPIYKLVYSIPYFSALRNPFKFLHPLHLILVVLFGYGLQGLWRGYINEATATPTAWTEHVKRWWKRATAWDRRWTAAIGIALGAALLAWLGYSASSRELIRHLQSAGFPDDRLSREIASFSIRQVGWFLVFLGLSGAGLLLAMSGALNGRRARWAGVAFGLLLVVDLVRADLPWIVYYDYTRKYATNPVIDFLRQNTRDYRAAAELVPLTRAYLTTKMPDGRPTPEAELFTPYYFEWLQHHFQYYRVPSLDIIQMPRIPEFDLAFMTALRPTGGSDASRTGRLWELTSSRYIIGMTAFLELLNQQVDPVGKRFRLHTTFNIIPKPGVANPTGIEDLTAVVDPNGPFALFEFTGAQPRARLHARWQVAANDSDALALLARPDFNPATNLLVAADTPVPDPPGTATNNLATPDAVEILHREPTVVRLAATSAAPTILLLNERHDPDWRVYVDGARQPLLRCNYMMRGVHLPSGQHTVEFRFEPSQTSLRITLAGFALAIVLIGYLTALNLRRPAP